MRTAEITCRAKRGDRKLKWTAKAQQVDSLDEYLQLAGSPDRALAYINESMVSDARSVGNARVRNAEEKESDEAAQNAAIALSESQNPSIVRARGRKPGEKTQKVAALDEMLAANLAQLSDAEKLAKVNAILARFGGA